VSAMKLRTLGLRSRQPTRAGARTTATSNWIDILDLIAVGLRIARSLAETSGTDHRRIHIDKRQHRAIARIGRLIEAGFVFPGLGIAETAEQDVPEREIAVVVAMVAAASGSTPSTNNAVSTGSASAMLGSAPVRLGATPGRACGKLPRPPARTPFAHVPAARAPEPRYHGVGVGRVRPLPRVVCAPKAIRATPGGTRRKPPRLPARNVAAHCSAQRAPEPR